MTDDPTSAGSATLEYRGGRFGLTACDLARDGYGVRAYAYATPVFESLGRPSTAVAISHKGAGTCGSRGKNPYTHIVARR